MPPLVRPSKGQRTQEPLKGEPAGLPTFRDRLHNVGRKEGESQHSLYVWLTQLPLARNFGCIGIFTSA